MEAREGRDAQRLDAEHHSPAPEGARICLRRMIRHVTLPVLVRCAAPSGLQSVTGLHRPAAVQVDRRAWVPVEQVPVLDQLEQQAL